MRAVSTSTLTSGFVAKQRASRRRIFDNKRVLQGFPFLTILRETDADVNFGQGSDQSDPEEYTENPYCAVGFSQEEHTRYGNSIVTGDKKLFLYDPVNSSGRLTLTTQDYFKFYTSEAASIQTWNIVAILKHDPIDSFWELHVRIGT